MPRLPRGAGGAVRSQGVSRNARSQVTVVFRTTSSPTPSSSTPTPDGPPTSPLTPNPLRTGHWGPVTEHRVIAPTGPEFEFGIAAPNWADLPLDPGTAKVLSDGARPIYDPTKIAAIAIAIATSLTTPGPDQTVNPGPTQLDTLNGPATARYCRACPPAGPITDLTCARYGDGPLLVGDLAADPAGADDVLPAAAQQWLAVAGWRLDGPVCPGCRPAVRM